MGGRPRKTLEECRIFALARGGRLLTTVFVDARTKMEWECGDCGHHWWAIWNNIQQGKWCPQCAIRKSADDKRGCIEDCHRVAAEHGGECLSTVFIKVISIYIWRCHLGHIWETSLHTIKNNGTWCPKCGDIAIANKLKGCVEDCQKMALKNGLKLISKEYVRSFTKYEWLCPKNHLFEATANDIQQGGGCPFCSHKSKPEARIFRYVSRLFSDAKPRKKKILSNWRYELDIWIPSLRKAIEFDGDYWHSTADARRRDSIKDELCKEAGIPLLRIKESEFKTHRNKTYKKIRDFLESSNPL